MSRIGRPRRDLLVQMTPTEGVVVDVGADHGRVASRLSAIGTERMPHRRSRAPIPWVIADGLRPFRRLDTAVIAGMGARRILRILDAGPRPRRCAVLHAPDDPALLRRGVAARAWRIEAEGLAPEAGRFAEVIRVVPGPEPALGLRLDFGPRLLEGADPHLLPHLRQVHAYWSNLAKETAGKAQDKYLDATARARFIASHIARLTAPVDRGGFPPPG